MMEELKEILNMLNMGVWLVDLISLGILFYVCQKTGRVNSSLLTMVLVVLVGFFMLGYQAILEGYIEANPGYNPVVNFFWYMGFAGFYAATLFFLKKIHKFKNVLIGSYGQYINNAVLVLGLIQLLQYAEIVLFKTDTHVNNIYTLGIPSINIVSAVIGLYFAIYAMFYVVYKDELPEELRWTI